MHSVKIQIRRFLQATLAIILLVVFSGHSAYADAATVRSERFGVIEPQDAPVEADALGVAWGRVRFHWATIQPNSSDEWNSAEITTDQLDQEIASGRESVGLLIGIPEWARDEKGLPWGLYLPPDDHDNLWANFVREAVSQHKGRINHWIIWNEPDVWDNTHPGFTWPGTEADYVQLLKTAYLVAKAENPDAVIHLAAVSHWWDALYGRELYFKRLLDVLIKEPDAAENNYYYDVATLHLYFNPADVYNILDEYRTIQFEHGIDKPFWLVETNAAPSTDPDRLVAEPTFRVSMLEQAAYMPQALSLAVAAGAERIAIYKLIDTQGDIAANPEPFGLVRSDGSLRPAFRTAQVAIQQLDDAEHVTWTDQKIVSQVVIEGRGRVARLLWSRIPQAQEAQIPALADHAIMIDMWGNETLISPDGGSYTIILYGGECQQTTGDYCMIGGPPVYIVEETSAAILLNSLTLTSQAWTGSALTSGSNAMGLNGLLWVGGGIALVLAGTAGLILRGRSVRSSN
jgi:hypothetical protein